MQTEWDERIYDMKSREIYNIESISLDMGVQAYERNDRKVEMGVSM